MTKIQISSTFDGGNIKVQSLEDHSNIRLEIRPDNNSDYFQWFHFRVTGAKGLSLKIVLVNASKAAFPDGWLNYNACASVDRKVWTRVEETSYSDGELIIEYTPSSDCVYFAYFEPYTLDRHHDFITEAVTHNGVKLSSLGESAQGRPMDCLSVGNGEKNIWLIARQHPGETMAEWWMEGFITRLLDYNDFVSKELLQKASFFIVPNMCPDGSFIGNLRTNFCGANLNREWNNASLEFSPEVYWTIKAMDNNKPSLCMDVHGDESLPYNFIAGAEGIPGYTAKQDKDLEAFLLSYKTASPDFQTKYGYPKDQPGSANLGMCTNYTANKYNCLSVTLEMPFKDNANFPNPKIGWNGDRSADLGASALDAISGIIDFI